MITPAPHLLTLAFLLSVSFVTHASPINLVIFGDSLSDTGNLFALTGGAIPPGPTSMPFMGPYSDGGFSNGPVWVDQLATSRGLGQPNNAYESFTLNSGINNFAVGGSYTHPFPFPEPDGAGASNNSNDIRIGAPVLPGLQQQVGLYGLLSGGMADPNAWHVLWAGANDLVFADIFNLTASDVALSAVNSIQFAIEQLYALDAREFMIMNLPDIGSTPLGFLSGRSAELTAGTDLFNGLLNTMLQGLAGTLAGIEIMQLDIHALFEDVLSDPLTAFPDANALLPFGLSFCFDQDNLQYLCNGANPDDRVFFDLLHPSSRTHGIIASAALEAKVPVPGTLLLIMLGMLGVVFFRPRQTK